MNSLPALPCYLKPRELAELRKIPVRTLRFWCDQGKVPCRRSKTGRIRIKLEDFDRFIRERAEAKRRPRLRQSTLSQTGVVYAIIDPRSRRVVYVGKASNLRARVKNHRHDWRRNRGNKRLGNLARKLQRQGRRLRFKVLEECLFGLDERERHWIAYGRAIGWPLCNVEDGGEGGEWDAESKRRQSERGREKYKDPEYVKRFTAAIEGRAAGRRGISIAEYRAWKQERANRREANRRQWRINMQKHAERAKPKEKWTFVPLTHKGTAFVPLTQGKWAMIDLKDWQRVGQYKWHAHEKCGVWRAKKSGPEPILLRVFVAGKGNRWRSGNRLDCRNSCICR